jgi:hypothetical protein
MYLVFFVTGPQKVGTTSEIFTGAIRRMVLVWHKARAIYGRVIFFSGRVNGIVVEKLVPWTVGHHPAPPYPDEVDSKEEKRDSAIFRPRKRRNGGVLSTDRLIG